MMLSGLGCLKNYLSEELQKMKFNFEKMIDNNENSIKCSCQTSSNTVNAEVKKTECEICLEPLIIKAVYSCNSCHNVLCVACVRKVNCCPFCRAPGKFAQRNFALERFLSTLTLPCKNQRYGCNESVDVNTREEHEKFCHYAPIVCPYYYVCSWSGDGIAFRKHLLDYHSMSLHTKSRARVKIKNLWSSVKITKNRKKTYTTILNSHNIIFVCKVSLFKDLFHFKFLQTKSNDEGSSQKVFGVYLEICGSVRSIKGIIPFFNKNQTEEIEVSPHFVVSQEDLSDDVNIYISIKCLDEDVI
ncbi:uncharacterized protein LOC142320540 [Lycorma delicatula]|uniref:uncharacterized protein LOC142320540 n=1 Tax=Lycorma delicatula TaxID=130591 RepID=UPI003F51579F